MPTTPNRIRPRFDQETLSVLADLKTHNERAWFAANKHRYDARVVDPALAFIDSMAPRIAEISRHFSALPKRMGGSLMRVYRDTRFARDKTPYKTNIGIQFRHERGKDVHAPGFYVHIEPGNSPSRRVTFRPTHPIAMTCGARTSLPHAPSASRKSCNRASPRRSANKSASGLMEFLCAALDLPF